MAAHIFPTKQTKTEQASDARSSAGDFANVRGDVDRLWSHVEAAPTASTRRQLLRRSCRHAKPARS
jgi:hypothetical protein